VIHHTKTNVVKVAEVNLATHRHSAVVESHKVVDGINVFELTDTVEALKHKLSTNIQEWKSKVEPALAAVNAGQTID
jgi:hypothetical protein